MIRWLAAFALTQLIEIPIYRAALRARTRHRTFVAFGASAITHPVVWFVAPLAFTRVYLALIERDPARVVHSPHARYAIMVSFAELFAVLVEAAYLRVFGLRRALGWSLLANGASVTVGFALRAVTGWP